MNRDARGRPAAVSLLGASALGALGVVFGDLGTSPLYALHDTFVGSHPVAVTRANVLGVLSLFIWSLIIVVSIKYLVVMMQADNRGEGGIFALLALTGATKLADSRRDRARIASGVLLLGIVGAALLYGDGVITPAISVLSAVEGLTVATPVFQPYVVPVTAVTLIVLFTLQPFGSGRIGRVFGPVLALWFLVIATIGVWGIARTPSVLQAVNPMHGVAFFAANGWHGFPVLGGVVLCLTGGEALYADMGHFGRRPIRVAWFGLAFPSLVLCYLGQGGVLLADPAAAENPFFRSAPVWSVYPLVALATVATVIASQALITAVFSLTSQAVQLGLSPHVKVVHTSSQERGQIYLPALNWVLMLACLALVLIFQSSIRLAAAYGLAVSGTMAITTVLFMAVARGRWKWGWPRLVAVAGVFLLIDLAFVGANVLKIRAGGWIPLLIGAVVFTLLSTWRRGRALLRLAAEQGGGDEGIESVLASVAQGSAARVRGTAVYLQAVETGIPGAFLHNLKHNKVVHDRVIFLTVLTEEVPTVPDDGRAQVTPLGNGFWRIIARYGFTEQPNVPALLSQAAVVDGSPLRAADTTYFVGRATIISAPKPGMARWREHLFGLMMRNAHPVTDYFGLNPNRVVELGAQVEI